MKYIFILDILVNGLVLRDLILPGLHCSVTDKRP